MGGPFGGGIEIDIADQPAIDTVDADVNHHRARLDPLSPDTAGGADRGHDQIGLPQRVGQFAIAMTEGGCCVGGEQHHGHGFADNVAAADNHRPLARQIESDVFEEIHDTQRGAGTRPGQTLEQPAGIDGVQAVNVLVRRDGGHQPLGGQMPGER